MHRTMYNRTVACVDKSTHQCGKVQTKVSQGKPRQDKARVRESRYVIKVMRDENKGE